MSFEDRQDLLGHQRQHITTHYSPPNINRLVKASETVVNMETEPTLRRVGESYNSPTEQSISALQSSQVLEIIGSDGWT